MTTTKEAAMTTGERVLRFRFKADPSVNAALAAELLARAAELVTPALPEAERIHSYEGALRHVVSSSTGSTEHKERTARRMHTHGMCHWHTAWVLYGSDGRGCSCAPCHAGRTS